MLKYASQPDDDWGPIRRENRYGRYEKLNWPNAKREKSNNGLVIFNNENVNIAFDSTLDDASRF